MPPPPPPRDAVHGLGRADQRDGLGRGGGGGGPNPPPRDSQGRRDQGLLSETPFLGTAFGSEKQSRDPKAQRCVLRGGRAPEGLAAALGLRTAVGLARFILSSGPRRSVLPTPHWGEDRR